MQALWLALDHLKDENITLTSHYPALPWFQSAEGPPLLGEIKYGILSIAYRPDQCPALFKLMNDTIHNDYTAFTELMVEDQFAAATNETP